MSAQDDIVLAKRLYHDHVRQHRGKFVLAFLLMAVVAASTGALAKLMQPILDDIFLGKDASRLFIVASLVFLAFFCKSVANYGQSLFMSIIGNGIVVSLQKRMFNKLMNTDMAYFDCTPTPTLVTRFHADARVLQGVVTTVVTSAFKDVLTLFFLVGVMFWQAPSLAAASFFVFPLSFIPIRRMGRRIRKLARQGQGQMGDMSNIITQSFAGIREVKTYGQEAKETHKADTVIDQMGSLFIKMSRVRSANNPIMEMLGGLAIIVVIVYGGTQVISGASTTGNFFSFITALIMAYEPIKRISTMNATLQEGMAAVVRLYDLFDMQPTIVDAPSAVPYPEGAPLKTVGLRDCVFQYPGHQAHVLKHVSLTLQQDQLIALVGASGSGKSTIMALLPRFYDPTAGAIAFNETDIRDYTLGSVRSKISYVAQDTYLFQDTILENVRYANTQASEDEAWAALKLASADTFVQSLPQGIKTVLAEGGKNLSGGQRQRLSIARALLRAAPLMILDEATSALDAETEFQIIHNLHQMKKGRIIVFATHRLAAIQEADHVIVMENGHVKEQDTPKNLLRQPDGSFARLCARLQQQAPAEAA